jgi:hypothetical protein
MAKKADAKGRAGSPLPAAGLETDDDAHGVTRPTTKPKSSAHLDIRVVYCGDNLEQLGPCRTDQFWGETKGKRAFEDRMRAERIVALALTTLFNIGKPNAL